MSQIRLALVFLACCWASLGSVKGIDPSVCHEYPPALPVALGGDCCLLASFSGGGATSLGPLAAEHGRPLCCSACPQTPIVGLLHAVHVFSRLNPTFPHGPCGAGETGYEDFACTKNPLGLAEDFETPFLRGPRAALRATVLLI